MKQLATVFLTSVLLVSCASTQSTEVKQMEAPSVSETLNESSESMGQFNKEGESKSSSKKVNKKSKTNRK